MFRGDPARNNLVSTVLRVCTATRRVYVTLEMDEDTRIPSVGTVP